ncbi:BMP family ABC transporter substrate-binding protein [Ketobacter sp. MCCC 1A13808]|uniref:BMP family ABC transporter substrate-binding protein n=1 Tax=Ketobacter sp. MCCC 1A13808 TaxID=2602738 RepID=UPI000F2D77C0|nr:BMP family ABC transporter substrate-binding protein [Ketobacter sp. MCCC 1A13808]MVF12072.1 BMP family ABC transporter substrate-binding protein [Ketobacter sp. MCCC 1A13808]RLP52845.1 MAG: BMP family ABC transporter substrate-binding protein [Ketobacter sp.]
MRNSGIKAWVAGLAAALGMLLTATAVQAEAPFKVGFVYVGPIGDHGWSYQHDQSRLALEKHFGDKVKTTYVENVPEGADAERVIRNLAKMGNKVIFTTSFGFMNPTAKVAKQFPKVTFLHATGYKRTKNLGTYVSKTYEGRYVAGYVAAKVTKSNKIGYIASFPIPEVIRDINAVQLALNKYNPEAELKVVWVNTWFDPGKEADAANAMMDQGVDVILQHTDSPAAMQAAERRGKYAVGQASDMSSFGPKAHLMSVVDDWSWFTIHTVQDVMDGQFKSRDFWGGMKEDMIQVPDFGPAVPEAVAAHAKEIIASIIDGSFNPFTGPIKDQSGKITVPDGKEMSHEELAAMNYYIEGVDGTIPK